MLGYVQVTDGFPTPTVQLIVIRTAAVLVILTVRLGSMKLTILFASEVGTTGVAAWFLWFVWHIHNSLLNRFTE